MLKIALCMNLSSDYRLQLYTEHTQVQSRKGLAQCIVYMSVLLRVALEVLTGNMSLFCVRIQSGCRI